MPSKELFIFFIRQFTNGHPICPFLKCVPKRVVLTDSVIRVFTFTNAKFIYQTLFFFFFLFFGILRIVLMTIEVVLYIFVHGSFSFYALPHPVEQLIKKRGAVYHFF